VLEAFEAPYMQRALAEVLLLAVLAGVLGTWIVLRGLAFSTHAIGTATFPGLVVAGPWGVAPPLTALATGLLFAAGVERLARGRRVALDAATGLLLVAALAVGVVLASDVYASGSGVDRLLFGTLIGLAPGDLWLTAGAVAGALAFDTALRRVWLAGGFDADGARALGLAVVRADRLLLLAVACAVVVSLDAVGALLVSVVLVVPAATVRLLGPRLRGMQLGTAALAAAEGVGALLLASAANVGPGPAMAVVGGIVFALTAAATALRARGVPVRAAHP
jgi:manganese/iron transport system permease protein